MPSMTKMNCKCCGKTFEARVADVNRGWGKFCSKSCKAVKQTRLTGISGPHYKAEGMSVKQMRKGKYAKSKIQGKNRKGYITNVHYEEWDDEVINGTVFWSDRLQTWVDTCGDDSHPFDSDAVGFNNT